MSSIASHRVSKEFPNATCINVEFAEKFQRGEYGCQNILDFFTYVGNDRLNNGMPGDSVYAKCNNCGKVVKGTLKVAGNLQRHATVGIEFVVLSLNYADITKVQKFLDLASARPSFAVEQGETGTHANYQ